MCQQGDSVKSAKTPLFYEVSQRFRTRGGTPDALYLCNCTDVGLHYSAGCTAGTLISCGRIRAATITSRFDCVAARYRNGASMKDSGSITLFSEWRSINCPMVYCVIAPNT